MMQRPPAASSSSTLPRNLMSGSLESVATEANNSRPNSMMMYDDEDLSSEYYGGVVWMDCWMVMWAPHGY